MKIALVSKADCYGGGASRIAVDLTAALISAGMDARHYAGWGGRALLRDRYPEGTTPVFGKSRLQRWAVKCGLIAQWGLGFPEAWPIEWQTLRHSGLLDADLIHVHDITELMSAQSLLWLSQLKPVIWTLHDSSPFTAGCIHPFDDGPCRCGHWRIGANGCGSDCPLRAERKFPFHGAMNGVTNLWRAKKKLAHEGRLLLTSPSNWLADEAAQSILYQGRRPEVVFNGIDVSDRFVPRDMTDARQALGLAPRGIQIAMIAGDLNDRNKGLAWGVESLASLPSWLRDQVSIICIGKKPNPAPEQLAGLPALWTDYIEKPQQLATWLAAANLLLYPSLADNQPLAVIEAMACGTPVFAFNVGGVGEIIGDGGTVVPKKDTAAMAAAVTDAIQRNAIPELSIQARKRAEILFNIDRMANDFIHIYHRTINEY